MPWRQIKLQSGCTKNDFVQEGVKREVNYKNGKYVNMIMMNILKEEFEVTP